jgi:hypothetical protein
MYLIKWYVHLMYLISEENTKNIRKRVEKAHHDNPRVLSVLLLQLAKQNVISVVGRLERVYIYFLSWVLSAMS